jgi:hypothetical protein
MGWKVNFWARLLDGNHAMKLIKDQLTLVDPVKSGHMAARIPTFSMRTHLSKLMETLVARPVLPKC